MEQNQQGRSVRSDLVKHSTGLKCESCENPTFEQVYLIRKISRLISGDATDSVTPIPTFQCASCGHINKEFTPKFENE